MNTINLEKTKDTPGVIFDINKNVFQIIGKSLPENALEFYKPLYDWIEEYCKEYKTKGLELTVELEYLNSSSIKLVFLIFNKVNEHFLSGNTTELVSINWRYNEQDELIRLKGEEFQEYLELPLNLVVID